MQSIDALEHLHGRGGTKLPGLIGINPVLCLLGPCGVNLAVPRKGETRQDSFYQFRAFHGRQVEGSSENLFGLCCHGRVALHKRF